MGNVDPGASSGCKIVLGVRRTVSLETYYIITLFSFQKFFQKWTTRGSMKDRTSALHHQTIWTMVAPKTSLNLLQQTWRTWRSITISGRIRAATLHPERWRTRGHVLGFSRKRQKESRRVVWETLGKGFSFSFGLLPEEPELPDSDGRPGRRRTSKETFQLCCPQQRHTETVDALWSSFFGITALTDSKRLTGGQSNLYVVCMYQLFEEKKKKKKRETLAAAEPSVPFDVIEIRLPFCHFFFPSFTTNVCPYNFDWKCQLDTFATTPPPCQLFTHCISNFWYIVTTYS